MGYIEGVLILISINIVAVCGVVILTGYTGLFSLGHAGFVSIGAYIAATLGKYFAVPFPAAMLVGGLAAALVSLVVGYPTLRGKLKGDYFAIAMMGFAEAIRLLFSNIYPYFNGALGLSGIPRRVDLPSAALICAVVIYFTYQYVHSQHGKLAVSIREQETAAELIGVNVTKEKLKSLMISAFLCGISGGMTAFYYTYMTPNTFSAEVSNNMLAAVVFGGMGSISGPVIACAVLTALPEFLRAVARWRLVIYGLLMIVVMLFRPEGLLGNKEISLYPLIRRIREGRAAAGAGIRTETAAAGAGAGAETGADERTEAGAGAEAETGERTGAGAGAKTAAAEAGAGAKTGERTEAGAGAKTGERTETGTGAETGERTEAETGAGAETGTGAGAETGAAGRITETGKGKGGK